MLIFRRAKKNLAEVLTSLVSVTTLLHGYNSISTPWQDFHRGICTHCKCFQVECFKCRSFLSHSPSSESRNLCPLNVNPFSSDIPCSGLCRVSCRTLSQWACTHQISVRSAPMSQAVMLSHHALPSSQHPGCTRKW